MRRNIGNDIRGLFQKLSAIRKKRERHSHAYDHTFYRLKAIQMLGFTPMTICDIGASNGRWSRKCIAFFPRASFFGVDPLEENNSSLERLKHEHNNFDYWLGCLGSKRCTAKLNVDGSGSSILAGHTANPYGVQRQIAVETLDNLIEQGKCPQPELIKLDVQGYELEVMKGAVKALSKTQAVIVETSFISFQTGMPIVHEVVAFMVSIGFVLYDILSLKLRPLDGAAGQSDLLFIKHDHPLRSSNKWSENSVY